jgi:hypothetical protein
MFLQVSNGGTHRAQLPSPPDGPESFKRATISVAGRDPTWEEEFVFPALLEPEGAAARGKESRVREFVMHVKHLAVGKRWTGNNEGEWLGKAVLSLSEIIASGPDGFLGVMTYVHRYTHVVVCV